MKRILSFLLIIIICCSSIITLTSCSNDLSNDSSNTHPVDQFKKLIEDSGGSYQANITLFDVPLLGTMTIILKVDGDIQYSPMNMMTQEYYATVIDGVKYKYAKNSFSGKWEKTLANDNLFSTLILQEQLFQSENYEKVTGEKNTYKQKKGVDFGDYEDVKIIVDGDSCTFEMKTTYCGSIVNSKAVISKIGEIELTLPSIK